MKRLVISFLILFCNVILFAQQRSEQEALQIAKEHFGKNTKKYAARVAKVYQKEVKNQMMRRIAPKNLNSATGCSYYIFNDEANARFVIVSADERFYKILGYSDNGVFDAANAPDALLGLLNSYDDQYDYMLKHEPNVSRVNQRYTDFPDIDPIIESKWGQESPYNDECPISIKSGSNCVTGCVATAMAMVMRHHRWPEQGQGSYSYVAKIDSTQSEELSMDFSSVRFNWDNLIDDYSKGAGTAEQRAEVAKLMKACGISVAMDYGAGTSGAQEYNIAYALTHYFGYNPNILYKEKDYYSNEEWDDMILTELKAGRPVLYGGHANIREGHSFIIDGCASDGTYHFNFGWNGNSDGNFYLQGTDRLLYYRFLQDMVYQVSKETVGNYEDVFYSYRFTSNKTAVKVGKSSRFNISTDCYSPHTAKMDNISDTFEGEVGIGLYDKDFNFIQSLYSEPCKDVRGAHSPYIYQDITFTPDIFKNGHEYIIAPYAKSIEAEKPTRIRTKGTAYDYYLAKVENDSVKLWIKDTEFHNIPLGTYKATAFDTNGNKVEWYVGINKNSFILSDYEYTIVNLDPNVVPDTGKGHNQGTVETDASGLNLTLSRFSTNSGVNVKNLTLDEDLTITYDTQNKQFTINGEWGSIRTTGKDDDKVVTELSRYSNTTITYISPDEMKVSIEDNKAGELANQLKESEKYFVNTLVVSGELNGTDIKEIRELITNGSLMHIDLSESAIVEGGDSYYYSYTTSNNVIGSSMFYEGKNIISLKLPKTTREIKRSAFSGCINLREIEIPQGVTSIENQAFSNCSMLSKVTLPYSVKLVGDNLFEGCESLVNIYCSSLSIDKLRSGDYSNVGELKAFGDISENCTWHVVSGKSELYKAQVWWKDSWSVVADMAKPYEDEIIIANNVAGSLSSQIPEDVANYITSLTVSGELNGTDFKQIRNMLQNGYLTTLDLHEASLVAGGEAYGSYYSWELYIQSDSIGEHMFEDSPYLETIKLPSNLKAIGEYAFYNCKNLRSLSIPEGIKVMENSILGNCEKLGELSIPSTIQVIDDYALNGCSSLGTIYCSVMEIGKIKASTSSYSQAGQLKAFDNISDGCTWHVVNGKSELYKAQTWWKDSWTVVDDIAKPYEDEIIIANNVAGSLGSQIPEDIAGYITSLTISGQINGTDIKQIRNMLQNGYLTTLDMVDASIVAGGEAYGSYYSKELYTQNDSIGKNMFEDSPCLETIKLPLNLKAIDKYAFEDCKSLRSLAIPEGVKVMEYRILGNCEKLEELSIPSTIQVIDDYALNGCSSLGTIYCSVMEIGKIKASTSSYSEAGQLKAFDNISDGCTWHVVNGKSELYKAQAWWKDSWSVVDDIAKPYEDEMIIANNVAGSLGSQIPEDIAGYITSLTISGQINGTDIKQIRNMLQNGYLTTLDMVDASIVAGGDTYKKYSTEYSVQNDTVSQYMFADCPYLETIKLPSNLKAIGRYAFEDCKSLRSLAIPEGIKIMEYQILHNCGKLEKLSIPSTIQVIDDDALNGCSSLGTIYCSVMEIGKIKASTSSYSQAGQLKAFDNISDGCTWHVVNGKSELYKAQTWWKDSWTVVDDIANVEEPEPEPKPELEKITLKLASDFQTYCSDKDLDFTNVKGLKVYIASGFNPDSCEVLLSHVNLVPAKTGMLLIGTAGQDYEVPYAETDFIYSNLFRGKLEDDEVTSGYVLDADRKEFVAVDGSVTVKGGEAYLDVVPVANAPRLKLRFAVTMDMSDAAGIDDILFDATAISGAWYTLQGVRLNGKPGKPGIYVHQGRKVVVK